MCTGVYRLLFKVVSEKVFILLINEEHYCEQKIVLLCDEISDDYFRSVLHQK